MQNIKLWISSIILASIICSVIDIFLPPNNKKIAKIILNLFMVLCIIEPIKHINFNRIFPNFEKKESVLNQIDSKTADIIKENIIHDIKNFLENLGVKAHKINIYFDKNTAVCELSLEKNEKTEEICEKLEKKFNVKVKLNR